MGAVILHELLSNHKDLIKYSLDEEGRTPLSYAALTGNLEVVEYLMQDKEFEDCAYEIDTEGSLAIHKAASGGNIEVINVLGKAKQLLNSSIILNMYHIVILES